MTMIRIMAAAIGAIAALSFTPAAFARDCGASACATAPAGAPLQLGQFAKTKKSAAAAKVRQARKATRPAKSAAPQGSEALAQADETAETAPAERAVPARETTGVAIASPDEVNEIDAAADIVRIVAADEVNEIDLAADTNPAARPFSDPAMQAMASADDPAADYTWIGRLVLALAGTVAVAAAGRMLLA